MITAAAATMFNAVTSKRKLAAAKRQRGGAFFIAPFVAMAIKAALVAFSISRVAMTAIRLGKLVHGAYRVGRFLRTANNLRKLGGFLSKGKKALKGVSKKDFAKRIKRGAEKTQEYLERAEEIVEKIDPEWHDWEQHVAKTRAERKRAAAAASAPEQQEEEEEEEEEEATLLPKEERKRAKLAKEVKVLQKAEKIVVRREKEERKRQEKEDRETRKRTLAFVSEDDDNKVLKTYNIAGEVSERPKWWVRAFGAPLNIREAAKKASSNNSLGL